MIQLQYNPTTDEVTMTTPAVIRAGVDIPFTIAISPAPGTASAFQAALTTSGANARVLAFTEAFDAVNDHTWRGVIDANDTRLIGYLTDKTTATLNLEFSAVLDGETRSPGSTLSLTVQPRAMSGADTSETGPVYLTQGQIAALYAPLASPALTGTPTAPTAILGTNTTQIATTAFVAAGLALKANLASPTFTGTPLAPTATLGTNTTQIATTAFVAAAVTALVNSSPGALDTLKELADAMGDDANFAATITTALAGKQALHANLTAFSGLTFAANKLVYLNGSSALALSTLTTAGLALLDDADAATQRATLSAGGARNFGTVTAAADYVMPVPSSTPSQGDQYKAHITASGADRNFKVNAAIKIPSDSSFNNSTGKTLSSGKTYIAQLEYMGSAWALTALVGGL